MELLRSTQQLLSGILRRFYIWTPALLFFPYDLWKRLINPTLPETVQFDLPWSPNWAPWTLIGLIFLATVLTYHELSKQNPCLSNRRRVLFLRRKDRDGLWPFCRVIPLTEAARIAYDVSQDTIAGGMARASNHIGEERLLSWFAHLIVGDELIPLYGIRPLSQKFIRVPQEGAGVDQFSNDASSLVDSYNGKTTFKNLAIRKSDFQKRLAKIRIDYGDSSDF